MMRFYRSGRDRILAGVCGGLGEALDMDPIIFRLLFIVFMIFYPVGAVAIYLAAAILMPMKPGEDGSSVDVRRIGDVVIGLVLTMIGFWVMTAALTSSIFLNITSRVSFPQFFNAVSLLITPTIGVIGLLLLLTGIVFVWKGLRRKVKVMEAGASGA